jgi:hypothetical protein
MTLFKPPNRADRDPHDYRQERDRREEAHLVVFVLLAIIVIWLWYGHPGLGH